MAEDVSSSPFSRLCSAHVACLANGMDSILAVSSIVPQSISSMAAPFSWQMADCSFA